MKFRILLLVCIVALAWNKTSAQDLEKIKDQKPVSLSGNLGVENVLYTAQGIDARRDPYYWAINGSFNINLYGFVDVPFSFFINQQDRSFTQNYNQFGFSPKYKAVTVHLGYRSMRFSDYTLAGIQFLGAGVEVMPKDGLFRVKAMYGRLQKAIPIGSIYESVRAQPSYERWGYGTSLDFGTKERHISLNLLKVTDDATSIAKDTGFILLPEENLLLGVSTDFKLTNRIRFSGEFTNSMYSDNSDAQEVALQGYTYANNFSPIFTPRTSSSYDNAYKAALDYEARKFKVGVSYERVDPNFRSLGAVYLNNDRENILLNTSLMLLNNKINLSGNIGTERNNLASDINTTMRRIVGGGNLNYNINPHWNFNAGYSNFRTESTPTLVALMDSLAYRQVTQNANGMLSYFTQKGNNNHSVNLGYSYQLVNDNLSSNTAFQNANLGYNIGFVQQKFNLFTSLNYSNFNIPTGINEIYTFSLGGKKSFLENTLNLSINASLNDSRTNGERTSIIHSYVFNAMYKLGKSHSFGLNSNLIAKNAVDATEVNSQELRVTVRYAFSFSK